MKLTEKWAPVLDVAGAPKIEDAHKRYVVAQLLENQINAIHSEAMQNNGHYRTMLNEDVDLISQNVVTNHGGDALAMGSKGDGKRMDGYDTVLINLVRRAMPQLIAFDVCGVQPMTSPVGMIFCMKARYHDHATDGHGHNDGREALYNEANSGFSGDAGTEGKEFDDKYISNWADAENVANLKAGSEKEFNKLFGVGEAMSTLDAEQLGMEGHPWAQMGMSIEKTTVTAKSRALRAEYTTELVQDLKAVHGLDANTEFSNILATEILSEMNREIIRTIYATAKVGCRGGTTAQEGVFDLDIDADGRWSSEKFKGLLYRIEREANAIAQDTRRGRGNFIICSSDVASALSMAGMLDYAPALQSNLNVNEAQTTFAGILAGKYKVYIDPYQSNQTNNQFCVVGYKGASPYDAGMYYCPYVPLQLTRAVDPLTMAPRIGFKTRYGIAMNPFVVTNDPSLGQAPTAAQMTHKNYYYRKFVVRNL